MRHKKIFTEGHVLLVLKFFIDMSMPKKWKKWISGKATQTTSLHSQSVRRKREKSFKNKVYWSIKKRETPQTIKEN